MFSVLPIIYCPLNDIDFELIDMINDQINQFNMLSGSTTFELNNYIVRRVHEGKCGNVRINGKEFFTPTNVWASRYSNHLSKNTLTNVIVDLRRHFICNFARTCPSVSSHVAMKYVLDSAERGRFASSSFKSVGAECVGPKVYCDKASQTERFPFKRDNRDRQQTAAQVEDARNFAKKKRQEKLQQAYSVLETHQTNVKAFKQIVSPSNAIEENFSKCEIKE